MRQATALSANYLKHLAIGCRIQRSWSDNTVVLGRVIHNITNYGTMVLDKVGIDKVGLDEMAINR